MPLTPTSGLSCLLQEALRLPPLGPGACLRARGSRLLLWLPHHLPRGSVTASGSPSHEQSAPLWPQCG